MRDGAVLYADVFRPDGGEERFPVIMNISVYQKDKLWVPPADLEEGPNPYMNWETANPLWWCPRGYALVRVDARGSASRRASRSPAHIRKPWISTTRSNGSPNGRGVPARSAPWAFPTTRARSGASRACSLPRSRRSFRGKGRADQYRDQAYHGGIFAMGFLSTWHTTQTANHLLGRPRGYNPDAFHNDLLWQFMRNDLDSEYWRACSARWDRITVPLYSAGNWGGFAMHLRGNTEGFMCAASRHKKLRIHVGTHFHPFHSEEGRAEQLRWFDHWLKGIDTGIMDEPPVKLAIPHRRRRFPMAP